MNRWHRLRTEHSNVRYIVIAYIHIWHITVVLLVYCQQFDSSLMVAVVYHCIKVHTVVYRSSWASMSYTLSPTAASFIPTSAAATGQQHHQQWSVSLNCFYLVFGSMPCSCVECACMDKCRAGVVVSAIYRTLKVTRKLCYRKDDRAMLAI